MEKIGENGKKITTVLILVALVAAGLIMLIPKGMDASVSSVTDREGHRFADSKNPEPKVEYNWIDAKQAGSQLFYGAPGDVSKQLFLPFSFPYNDDIYNSLYVNARGYVSFTSNVSSTSQSGNLPQSAEPNSMIAVAWCSAYCNDTYGGIWYLSDTAVLDPWFCIEWNDNSEGMTFELLLFRSGLIKMQYKELGSHYAYQNGEYLVVGIENRTGMDALVYSMYSDANLEDEMAVEFSEGTLDIEVSLTDGDGEGGRYCYAEYGYYDLQIDVTDTKGASDVTTVWAYINDGSGSILDPGMRIGVVTVTGLKIFVSDFDEALLKLDVLNCTITNVGDTVTLNFRIMIMFDFPATGEIAVTVLARGLNSQPKLQKFMDVFYLENEVKFGGPLVVTGEKNGLLSSEDFTMENESVTFSGLRLIYNNTHPGIYPQNRSYFMVLADYDNDIFVNDKNCSGRNMSIKINMPMQAITKNFNFLVDGIADEQVLSTVPTFSLVVDNSPPPAPQSVVIRADSYKDRNQELDNDELVYLTWTPVSDLGSGLARYRVGTTYSFLDPDTTSTSWDITRMTWNGTEEGDFKIFVWAEDEVGHYGSPAFAQIRVDKTDVEFYDDEARFGGISPKDLETNWINTLTPRCKMWFLDIGGSGVDEESVEYSISTEGKENFQEWKLVDIAETFIGSIWDDPYVVGTVTPRFSEGTDNWIRFRAKDKAGNGYTESNMYRLKIDVTQVQYSEFMPTEDAWHDIQVVNDREISLMVEDHISGIDTAQVFYRVSTGSKDGVKIWDTSLLPDDLGWKKYSVKPSDIIEKVEESNLVTKVNIHFLFEDFKEGDNNYIQFLSKDLAGTGDVAYKGKAGFTESDQYNLKVNTKPVATISSPGEGERFDLGERFTLDGSGSYDIDADLRLNYEWKYLSTGSNGSYMISIGTDEVIENWKFESRSGLHTIYLFVGDSIHRYNELTGEDRRSMTMVNITINEAFYPSNTEDTDGDGMDDRWEWDHQTDYLKPDGDVDLDNDGYTNLEEYLGVDGKDPYHGDKDGNDPWDPADRPFSQPLRKDDTTVEAPFEMWVYLVLLAVAVIVAALVVLMGYMRIHRREEMEQREEAEEDAMLATPQIEIPTMPQIPMVDTSVPSLPAPQAPIPESGAVEGGEMPPQETPEGAVTGAEPQPQGEGYDTYQQPPQQQDMYQAAPQGEYQAAPGTQQGFQAPPTGEGVYQQPPQ